jgi:hypothetical protein
MLFFAAGNGAGWHVVGALVGVATRNASAVVAAHADAFKSTSSSFPLFSFKKVPVRGEDMLQLAND